MGYEISTAVFSHTWWEVSKLFRHGNPWFVS